MRGREWALQLARQQWLYLLLRFAGQHHCCAKSRLCFAACIAELPVLSGMYGFAPQSRSSSSIFRSGLVSRSVKCRADIADATSSLAPASASCRQHHSSQGCTNDEALGSHTITSLTVTRSPLFTAHSRGVHPSGPFTYSRKNARSAAPFLLRMNSCTAKLQVRRLLCSYTVGGQTLTCAAGCTCTCWYSCDSYREKPNLALICCVVETTRGVDDRCDTDRRHEMLQRERAGCLPGLSMRSVSVDQKPLKVVWGTRHRQYTTTDINDQILPGTALCMLC